jgi:hypothetical protein
LTSMAIHPFSMPFYYELQLFPTKGTKFEIHCFTLYP